MMRSCGCAQSCGATAICDVSSSIIKPIRIIQFMLIAALFALTVYTISRDTPYEKIEEIPLTVLYGSFFLVTLVDIISQCCGEPIPQTPMFLFGVVGAISFLVATCGVFIVTYRPRIIHMWRMTTSMVLSGVCSLLYLLDIFLIYLYGY